MIRLANERDLSSLLRICREFHAASPYHGTAFDEPRVSQVFAGFLRADRKHSVVLMAEQDGEVIGTIVCTSAVNVWNQEKTAYELIWWVDPEHRNGPTGMRLLKEYFNWAKQEAGCTMVTADHIASDPRYGELYVRLGLVPVSCSYQGQI